MVTLIKYGALGGGEKYNVNQMWIDGLSTDTPKPTTTIDGMGIPNGSVYTEVDTGKTYMFDYDNTTWHEVSIGGGGGGGDITSANVTAMTGYEIAEEAEAIETTDTLNEAIGKLEKGVSDNETNISSIQSHIVFSANSKTYYLQPEQPSNPQDGDIWIG